MHAMVLKKYILLKHEYHKKYSNTKIQQIKKVNMYSYSIRFSLLFSLELFLIQLLKNIHLSYNFTSTIITL